MQDTVLDLSKAELWDPDMAPKGKEYMAMDGFVFVPPERYGKRTRVAVLSHSHCKVRKIRMTSEALCEICGTAIRIYSLTSTSGQEALTIVGSKNCLLMGKGATSLTRATVSDMKMKVEGPSFMLKVRL